MPGRLDRRKCLWHRRHKGGLVVAGMAIARLSPVVGFGVAAGSGLVEIAGAEVAAEIAAEVATEIAAEVAAVAVAVAVAVAEAEAEAESGPAVVTVAAAATSAERMAAEGVSAEGQVVVAVAVAGHHRNSGHRVHMAAHNQLAAAAAEHKRLDQHIAEVVEVAVGAEDLDNLSQDLGDILGRSTRHIQADRTLPDSSHKPGDQHLDDRVNQGDLDMATLGLGNLDVIVRRRLVTQ
jgi:hypothetical protein